MKERLFTLVCALGALALFATLFVRGTGTLSGGKSPAGEPNTEDRRGNGYYAALRWLDREHVPTLSLRERFDKLTRQKGVPPTGNLLIVTLPVTGPFKTEEFHALDAWARAGNTVLVMASMFDAPDWAVALRGVSPSDLRLLTGLEFETVVERVKRLHRQNAASPPLATSSGARAAPTLSAGMKPAKPARLSIVPIRPHAFFSGVREVLAVSDYQGQPWSVRVPYDGFVFSLARQPESGDDILWTAPLGKGQVIVSGAGSIFSNRALGLADNGRLLANIVAQSVQPGSVVLFDDAHQGLASAYDPARFYSDPRLFATVAILIAVWLCWVLGSTGLRMPVHVAPVPREGELVQATGSFLARVLGPDVGALGLLGHAFRRWNERLPRRQFKDEPPWEYLERHPQVLRGDLTQLQDWYAAANAGRRVPLVRLHNLIQKIDRQLAA